MLCELVLLQKKKSKSIPWAEPISNKISKILTAFHGDHDNGGDYDDDDDDDDDKPTCEMVDWPKYLQHYFQLEPLLKINILTNFHISGTAFKPVQNLSSKSVKRSSLATKATAFQHNNESLYNILILFRIGLFGAAHGSGECKESIFIKFFKHIHQW